MLYVLSVDVEPSMQTCPYFVICMLAMPFVKDSAGGDAA